MIASSRDWSGSGFFADLGGFTIREGNHTRFEVVVKSILNIVEIDPSGHDHDTLELFRIAVFRIRLGLQEGTSQ